MFREEMQVLGLPGAEDVTDGSVDYYDMDWENVDNGVFESEKSNCPENPCSDSGTSLCEDNRPERRDGGADGKVHRKRVRLHAAL